MMTVHAAKGLEFLCFCHRLEQDLFLTREWVRDLNQKKTGESVAFYVPSRAKKTVSFLRIRAHYFRTTTSNALRISLRHRRRLHRA